MTPIVEWLAGLAHPRLGFVSLAGAVGVVVGLALSLLGQGAGVPGSTGLRLAIAGGIVFLFGATGYLAFALFEAAER